MGVIGELALQTGIDIPFREGGFTIHNPTLKEISYIGEDCFLIGIRTLNFSKELLEDKDKNGTKDSSNFDILLTILKDDSNAQSKKIKACVMLVLFLIFPDCEISFNEEIILIKDEKIGRINNSNFEEFKKNISELFCLNQFLESSEDYNPGNQKAKEIAEKLKKGRAKVNAIKDKEKEGGDEDSNKVAIYAKYLSILSVGLNKDKNELRNYTVYQLLDEFKRFTSKQSFDIALEARMAGAKDLDEIDNWMN